MNFLIYKYSKLLLWIMHNEEVLRMILYKGNTDLIFFNLNIKLNLKLKYFSNL
jgi:mannosyltransferase OCH1-like enzyme